MVSGASSPDRCVLVAGASGVVGTAVVEHFARLAGWRVLALSRRRPAVSAGCRYTHIPVDLTDREACAHAIAALPPVSHLVYGAVSEAPGLVAGWRDPTVMRRNGEMFANLAEPLAEAGQLAHISLMQGAKAYGGHLHSVSVPLREDSARDPHPNFYWLQENLLREICMKARCTFTIWRPQVIIGAAPGAAMNPVAAIGAYAAICRARGLPFALPGGGEALLELVDAELLAEAIEWGATAPQAIGRTFNITNGDCFVLRHAWGALADRLGLSSDGAAPENFAGFFADPANQQAWEAIAARHNLVSVSLDRLLGMSHQYLDLLSGRQLAAKTFPTLLSTIALRQAGFAPCRDSFEALLAQLHRMTDLRLLPAIV